MLKLEQVLLNFVLNALWQVPVVAVTAWLASRWMRTSPARHRHAVFVGALAVALLLPAAGYLASNSQSSTYRVAQTALSPIIPRSGAPASSALTEPARTSGPSITFGQATAITLTAVYLLVAGFGLLRLLWAVFRTFSIWRDATVPGLPAPLRQVRKRCQDALQVASADVRTSAGLVSPVAAANRILLPQAMLAETDEGVLTTAIGHEMAHLVRRDFAWNLFCELLFLPIWFHPAAAWLRREIGRTRELACDELVTARLLAPRVYAESILKLARTAIDTAKPGYALGVFDGDILEERIRRILAGTPHHSGNARWHLAGAFAALALCAVLASGFAVSAFAQSAALPEMRLAAAAFNQGDFAGAVEHFERAVAADPGNLKARLFLAHALHRDFLANAPKSPDESVEQPLIARARQQYQEVLARDARNTAAMIGLAGLAGPNRRRESRDLLLQVISVEPGNRNGYYSLGVLDWQMVYPPVVKAMRETGGSMMDYWVPDQAVRARLRQEWQPSLEEGFRVLQIANELDAGDGDAMAYINLLFRLQGAIADSRQQHDQAIEQADAWVGKALGVKRARKSLPQSSAIDVDGPPPTAVPAIIAPPPPPPPPPPPGTLPNRKG